MGWLRRSIGDSIESRRAMLADDRLLTQVDLAATTIADAFDAGRKLILFGNGGSAADASHLAAEFVGRFVAERRALPAVALADNTAAVSAIGNDYGFDSVFCRGIEAFAKPGDVALGLTTSGASVNVIHALRRARDLRAHTVVFTGAEGADCGSEADIWLRTPASATARVQEDYMLLCHALCERVESLVMRA